MNYLYHLNGILRVILICANLCGVLTTNLWAKNQTDQYKSAKKTMRILVMVDRFPWYTKQVIINQVIGLLEQGHDVDIFAQEATENYVVSDPRVQKYNILDRVYYKKLPPNLNRYDIIMCQYGYLGKKFCYLKKHPNVRAKLVTFFRGKDITHVEEIKAGEYDALFACGDLFLPICEYFKFRLALLNCDADKIAVQRSGIDCSQFPFKKRVLRSGETVQVISVGRLGVKKGCYYSIQAIAELLNEFPNVKYTIVGDGAHRQKLEKLVCDLGIQDKVVFTGWLDQGRVAEILSKAHIFILPSVTTGKGSQDAPTNALKEAMLQGLPVVTTYHGGIPELVEYGVSGFMVPERDVFMLVKCLRRLIKHSEGWASMGKAGREKVKKFFDMKILNNRLEKLLLNCLEKRKTA